MDCAAIQCKSTRHGIVCSMRTGLVDLRPIRPQNFLYGNICIFLSAIMSAWIMEQHDFFINKV